VKKLTSECFPPALQGLSSSNSGATFKQDLVQPPLLS